MIFHQYKYIIENTQDSNSEYPPLKEIIHIHIDNEKTNNAMFNFVEPASTEEIIFEQGSDGYYAALGSPNGRSAAILPRVYDNISDDGEPIRVGVVRADSNEDYYGLAYLRIVLRE